MKRQSVLIIEDDVTIMTTVAYALRRAGFEVLEEGDGKGGLETALRCPIDLAIVDVMLPQLDGLAVSRALSQRKPDLPLLIITALSEKSAMMEGFEAGVDDYITKPFDIDELLARVSARLRRKQRSEQLPGPVAQPAGFSLDRNTHLVAFGQRAATLSPKEFDLLEMLLSDPGHLFTREEIAHGVWHHQHLATSRTLDAHMRRLRTKLAEADAPVTITAVRGVGYRADMTR